MLPLNPLSPRKSKLKNPLSGKFAGEPCFQGIRLTDQKRENLSETVFQRGFALLCPFYFGLLERKTRLELATPTLARLCSTN